MFFLTGSYFFFSRKRGLLFNPRRKNETDLHLSRHFELQLHRVVVGHRELHLAAQLLRLDYLLQIIQRISRADRLVSVRYPQISVSFHEIKLRKGGITLAFHCQLVFPHCEYYRVSDKLRVLYAIGDYVAVHGKRAGEIQLVDRRRLFARDVDERKHKLSCRDSFYRQIKLPVSELYCQRVSVAGAFQYLQKILEIDSYSQILRVFVFPEDAAVEEEVDDNQ